MGGRLLFREKIRPGRKEKGRTAFPFEQRRQGKNRHGRNPRPAPGRSTGEVSTIKGLPSYTDTERANPERRKHNWGNCRREEDMEVSVVGRGD